MKQYVGPVNLTQVLELAQANQLSAIPLLFNMPAETFVERGEPGIVPNVAMNQLALLGHEMQAPIAFMSGVVKGVADVLGREVDPHHLIKDVMEAMDEAMYLGDPSPVVLNPHEPFSAVRMQPNQVLIDALRTKIFVCLAPHESTGDSDVIEALRRELRALAQRVERLERDANPTVGLRRSY